MNGYNTSNQSNILGTNNLFYNTITDGIVTLGGGDMTGGNLISTKSLYVNGINILASGSAGPQGIQGVHGTNVIFTTPSMIALEPTVTPYVNDTISSVTDTNGVITNTHNLTFGINKGTPGVTGPQGAKGDKGEKGDSGTSPSEILGALVDLGLAAGEVALGATVVQLYTDVATLQGEVSTITSDVALLQLKTTNMTHNLINHKTNFSVSKLAIDNGVSDKITLSNDGTIDCTTLNVDTLNTDIINVPEIEVTNINPHTVLGGAVGTGINIGTSYTGVNVNMINIGNPIAMVNLVGLVSCNGRLISDPLHVTEFINQF